MSQKQNEKDLFGDRMKSYEAVETERAVFPGCPVYVRLDGRSFSKFTKGLRRPYDRKLSWIMVEVAKHLAKEFKADLAYTQSDEISLGWKNTDPDSEFMFGGRIQKLISTMAGVASAKFNQLCLRIDDNFAERALKMVPSFDARLFQLPSLIELMNAFVWREQDGRRNAISMAAQSRYSHKSLQGVSSKGMLERMKADGVDFDTFYPQFFRCGTYLQRVLKEYPVPDSVPIQHRTSDTFIRSSYEKLKTIPKNTDARMWIWFGATFNGDIEI